MMLIHENCSTTIPIYYNTQRHREHQSSECVSWLSIVAEITYGKQKGKLVLEFDLLN